MVRSTSARQEPEKMSTTMKVLIGVVFVVLVAALVLRSTVWKDNVVAGAWMMVLVGAVLAYETAGTSAAFWPAYGLNALTVGLGEAIACLVLGVLLVKQLPKIPYFRNRLAS